MMKFATTIYRLRAPLYCAAAVVLISNAFVSRFITAPGIRELWLAVVLLASVTLAVCLILGLLVPRRLSQPGVKVVASPVRGRWLALNSPASAVPSHGVRLYGQAYAIDLVAEPLDQSRPAFGGQLMRASSEYPAFGEPVFAMIDGEVVSASGWRRDHRARSNGWGIAYLLVEGMIRELGGPGFIVGNHVTIRSADGTYALVAHLQQGSVTVKVGDHVTAGTIIGRCGNSGNSSEPHVHAQLMDRASLWTAQGLPMAFAGIGLGDDADLVDALPANEQHMTVA